MASFLDNISQFNPYIQQLPIEAMTTVGLAKQQKYDEGVQKIQGYIDSVAGMDVARDIDKAYLQGKLNELGSKLKTVAAGDFSNYQLVNSVGGMATQIGKDSVVQNAVMSTKKYRKGIEEMETAIKKGKSSQANIYDFNTKASSWLNSNELGQGFNDRYTHYIDVGKKASEAIKALHPKLQQYDIPFKIDPETGAIDKTAVGDALKRYKIEGISEDQIEQAIRASLTPDDVNQLQIDANYRFRDVTPDSLVKAVINNYSTSKREATSTLEYLRGQLGIASDPAEKDKIQNRITYYENLLGKDGVKGLLDESFEYNIKNAKENPNSVKLSIYKDGFIKEYANAFSWKNVIETYEDNPLRKQMNWVEDMNLKREQERRQRYEFKVNTNIKEREIELRQQEINLKAEENALQKVALYGDATTSPWTPLTNPTDTKLRSEEYFVDHLNSVKGNVEGDMALLQSRYTPLQINGMLKDWQENGPKAKSVPSDAIQVLERLSKNQNYLASLQDKDKKLRTDAENAVRERYLKDPEYLAKMKEKDEDLKSLDANGPIPIKLWRYAEGGRGKLERVALNKTPSQILNDVKSGIAEFKYDRGAGGEIKVKYKMNGKVYETTIDKSSLAAQAEEGASEARVPLVKLASHLDKYSGFFSMEKSYKDDVDKEYKNRLAPLISEIVPQIKAVARTKDGKIPPAMFDKIKQLVIATADGGYKANDDFEESVITTMLTDENIKDTNIFIHRKGDDYEVRVTNSKSGSPAQVIKLTGNDIAQYFGEGYVSNKTQESIRLGIGNGNTNLTGDPTKAMMQKSFGDFPGIKKMNITADLRSTLSNQDLYTPFINIKKKDGKWASFPITGENNRQTLGFDQAMQSLNTLTDDNLLKLLKEHYPNYDFSQLDY